MLVNKSLLFIFVFCISVSTCFSLDYSVDFPEEVEVGEWFTVNISVSSLKPVEIETYSYVYDGFNCVSQGWISNKEVVLLEPEKKETIQLKDLIKSGTEEGIYSIRAKVNFENKTVNATDKLVVVDNSSSDMQSFLYPILVGLSIAGLLLFFKFNK